MRQVIIGIGNDMRGDDAAGLLVARLLKKTCGDRVDVFEARSDAGSLMELWSKASCSILVDAACGMGEAGSIHRFDAIAVPLPHAFGTSTHAIGVAETIELARSMGTLPSRLIVFGIEGRVFTNGSDPTPEVAAAVTSTAQLIKKEIGC